jgi:hypothetical protein
MRESTRSTTWRCDGTCGITTVLSDGYQDVPPSGWRVIHILPASLNLALEAPGGVKEHRAVVLCTECFGLFRGLLSTDG